MNSNEKSLKKSLLLMVFVAVAFSVTVTGVIVSVNFYLDYKKSLKENVVKVGERLRSDLERVYSLGLTFNDLPEFETDVKKIVTDEKILAYIIVSDKSGAVNVTTLDLFKNKVFKHEDGDRVRIDGEDVINIAINVLAADKTVAYRLHLGLKESLLNSKIYATLLTLIVVCLMTVAFIFGIAKTFIENRLINPLLSLKDGTSKMAKGNLCVRIETTHHDEVGTVTANFTQMVDEIREIVMSLKNATKQLGQVNDIVEALSHNVKDGSEKQLKSASHILELFKNIEDRVTALKGKVSSLNDFIELITSTFLELSSSSEEIFRTMEELLKSVEKVDDAYKKINQTNDKLDEGADALAKEVENILSYVSQMDSAVKMTLSNVSETSQIADKMDLLARESKKALHDTIKNISKIALASQDAKESFVMLKNSIGKINNILNVIEEIAEQTNMLALNAAIIAAQNEEGGKAFSVVADEIKELSKRTQSSTKEIVDLITVITEQTEKVFAKIQENANDGAAAEKYSKDIEQKIGEIIELIGKVTSGVKEILKASNEQSQGSTALRSETEVLSNLSKELKLLRDEGKIGSKTLGEMVDFISEVAGKVGSSVKEQTESIANVKHSVIDLSGFSKDMLEHIENETKEFNYAKPVLVDIQKLATDNSDVANRLDDKLNELKAQIKRFKEITQRFIVEE